MTATRSLRPEHTAVRTAREFSRSQLRAEAPQSLTVDELDGLADDAALVVSELVTNAIRADASTIELKVGCTEDLFLISVTDDAPGVPAMADVEKTAAAGRGLHIVEALSARWGMDALARGKRVWAELRMPGTVVEISAELSGDQAEPPAARQRTTTG